MAAKQVIEPHPLGKFGHGRIPHWVWRTSPRLFAICSGARDIWLVASGRCSLHMAWQSGYDDGTLAAIKYSSGQFNFGVEMACRRIEDCNDETKLMCRLEAARALKKPMGAPL